MLNAENNAKDLMTGTEETEAHPMNQMQVISKQLILQLVSIRSDGYPLTSRYNYDIIIM